VDLRYEPTDAELESWAWESWEARHEYKAWEEQQEDRPPERRPRASSHQVVLSDEQERAIERLLKLPRRVQTLGGYAGTGKTTVIRTLTERLSDYAVCAFTGKAANVLRRKDVPATTIHSLIYTPREEVYRDKKGRWRTRVVFDLKSSRELEGIGG